MTKKLRRFTWTHRLLLVQVIIWGTASSHGAMIKRLGVSTHRQAPGAAQSSTTSQSSTATQNSTAAQTPATGQGSTAVPSSAPGQAASPATPGTQTPVGAQSSALPDAPGKSDLMQVCTKCHAATQVLANRQNRQGWEDTITKMAGFGAVATDEQFSSILEYLVKYCGPQSAIKVDVNTATAAAIVVGLKLTDKDAEAIVSYRASNGPFKSLDELKKVPGIDTKQLDASRDLVAF